MADLYGPIQSRIDSAATWSSDNPVMLAGEIGITREAGGSKTGIKIGDGSTAWKLLGYGPDILGSRYGDAVMYGRAVGGQLAFGSAYGDVRIAATALGATAGGYAYANVNSGSPTAEILGQGKGSFASGAAYTYNWAATGYAKLATAGKGSHAFGYVYSYVDGKALMEASGQGSMVMGYVYGADPSLLTEISAQNRGTFAGGSAESPANSIIASGRGAFQWGPGTNAVDQSLAVGGALRLNCLTGTPGALRNGDQWEASGYVYIRSGGVSVKIVP